MKNWKELEYPFEDFNEEITLRWISEGFTKEQAREWFNVDEFTSFESIEFGSATAYWLQNIANIQPKN